MTRRMEMKIKDFIYKYSIRLFILIVAYLIVSFPFQYTQEKMNDVSQPVRWLGTLLFFIIACFIVRYRKKLETVFAKKSLFFIIFVMISACRIKDEGNKKKREIRKTRRVFGGVGYYPKTELTMDICCFIRNFQGT